MSGSTSQGSNTASGWRLTQAARSPAALAPMTSGATRDGRVEAAFEGPADEVLSMVNWCGTGPPHAVVSGVELVDEEPTGEAGFVVR